MRNFLGFLGAIFAAAIAGLLVVAFQGPIAKQFSADRLSADVYAGPWTPIIDTAGDTKKLLERQLSPYAVSKISEGDHIYYSDWHLENKGSKRVENIRIDFDQAIPEFVLITQKGKPPLQTTDPRTAAIPPMAPGDSLHLQIVTIFDVTSKIDYSPQYIKTYSSEGPISIKLISAQQQYLSDPVSDFIEKYVFPATFFIIFIIAATTLPMSIHLANFSEAIIKDVLAYRREKKRYDNNPIGYDYSIKKK